MSSEIRARFRVDRRDFTLAVDLTLPGSGVTALFGPSGSGKTTCLRAMAGLERAADGLFAIGEVGCTGLHGANRLASNSLLEGNVVARRALDEMMRLYPPGKEAINPPAIPEWEHGDTAEPDELVVIYHNWDEIRRLMWDYVSIVRTDNRLRRAAARLKNLKREVREFYWGHRENPDILELRYLVAVAGLIVECALRRKESRGLHYTLDHPESDEHYRTDTLLRKF